MSFQATNSVIAMVSFTIFFFSPFFLFSLQVKEDIAKRRQWEIKKKTEKEMEGKMEENEGGNAEIGNETKQKTVFEGDLSIFDIFEEKKKEFLIRGSL